MGTVADGGGGLWGRAFDSIGGYSSGGGAAGIDGNDFLLLLLEVGFKHGRGGAALQIHRPGSCGNGESLLHFTLCCFIILPFRIKTCHLF